MNYYDLVWNRYKGQKNHFTKDDIYVLAENISRAENGEYCLSILRNILNGWYDNLDDELKLKLELLGDDYE